MQRQNWRPLLDDQVRVTKGPLAGRVGRVTKASYADRAGDRLGADRVLVFFRYPKPTSQIFNRSALEPDTSTTRRHA